MPFSCCILFLKTFFDPKCSIFSQLSIRYSFCPGFVGGTARDQATGQTWSFICTLQEGSLHRPALGKGMVFGEFVTYQEILKQKNGI